MGADALASNTTGVNNTANGVSALAFNTTGNDNTANGLEALFFNTTGVNNTANGVDALAGNTTGDDNTADGVDALVSNTTGNNNTATGAEALHDNTTGVNNTANGFDALYENTTGSYNTATGHSALQGPLFGSTGSGNTANGFQALYSNTASFNTASGYVALFSNTSGGSNTANGAGALFANTTGNLNTADGDSALISNTTGNSNTSSGFNALGNNTTGSSNIALGASAGANLTTGSNNIYIGNAGISSGESAKIRIGTTGTQRATFIAGISGVTVPAGVGVIVGTDGKLGTVVSSARFKDNIQPMDKASEAILALKPVTFEYKPDVDPQGIPQFGLVAEEVEKVNPDLVARDEQGKPYSVRDEAVNAMLLNEFLKQYRKGQEQDATISQLKAELAQQQKQIEALTADLQNVSAQLELNKPAPRTVLNNSKAAGTILVTDAHCGDGQR